MPLVRTSGIIRKRVPPEHTRDARIDWHCERIHKTVRKSQRIQPGAIICIGYRHHLRSAKHLAEALVLREIKSAAAAIVKVRQEDGPSIGEPKFVAAKRRNPAGIGERRVIKVIARVE